MFSWHSIPFARYLMAYIIGIFVSIYLLEVSYQLLLLLIIIFLLASYFLSQTLVIKKYKFKNTFGLLILVLFLLIGVFRTNLNQQTNYPNYFKKVKHAKFYQVEINRSVVEKPKFYRAYAEVIKVIDSNGNSFETEGKILLYLSRTLKIAQPKTGNRYIVLAHSYEIPPPANPGEFNYKQFLSYQNIRHQTFVYNHVIQSQNYNNSIFRFAEMLRDDVRQVLVKAFKNKEVLGVAEALLIGYKDDLDQEVVAAFSRTGTLHVLAVSGLHAGIIYWILGFLTGFLKRVPRGVFIQIIIIVLSLWLYAFITGLSASVMRSALMFSVVGLSKLFNRRANIFNTIYVSAFIILVINPLDIVNVSFQLSYAALLGIVFVQPMINNWYAPYYKVDKFIWGLISVSFAAQLFTFPLGVYYFHQFPNYFLFSNLIVIPLTILILILLIALVSLSWIPIVYSLLVIVSDAFIRFNNFLVLWLDQLPGSYFNGLHIGFLQLILVYLSIFLLLMFFSSKQKQLFFAFLFVLLMLTISFSFINIHQQKQRILTFHDIKKHDVYTCIEGEKVYIISDSNFLSNKSAIRFHLEPYLWENGINQIVYCDFSKNHSFKHLIIYSSFGFQFFDKKMTMYAKNNKTNFVADFVVINKYLRYEDLNKLNKCSNLFYSKLSPLKMQLKNSKILSSNLKLKSKFFIYKW